MLYEGHVTLAVLDLCSSHPYKQAIASRVCALRIRMSLGVTMFTGVMPSPSVSNDQLQPKPDRRSRQVDEGEELGRKPKKVNSEVRKKQNRIASRNYRESEPLSTAPSSSSTDMAICTGEKRKRKLQYLQQLVKDESNDEKTPEPSPTQQEAHLRHLSADSEAEPSSSSYALPFCNELASMTVNGPPAFGPVPTSSIPPFDNHKLPTTQKDTTRVSFWETPVFDPPPPANMMWHLPMWTTPSTNHSSGVAQSPESLNCSPPLGMSQPVFDQSLSPFHHPRELMPNTQHDLPSLSYGHYDESGLRTLRMPRVNLSTSSPYFQGNCFESY